MAKFNLHGKCEMCREYGALTDWHGTKLCPYCYNDCMKKVAKDKQTKGHK